MEGELFALLYDLTWAEAKLRFRTKRVRYCDALIALVYFWSVLHDRPVCWACRACNWPPQWAWLCLPSNATMSRRLKTYSCWSLIIGLFHRLLGADAAALSLCHRIDTKPLVVGGFSKDRDARRGYATGGIAKGYKLAIAVAQGSMPQAMALASLKHSDQQMAMELIDQLSQGHRAVGGYLLADSTHDTNPLHQHAASASFQLLTPRKRPHTALGHRTHCPARLRSIELLEGESNFGKQLYDQRSQIERDLAHVCSFGGGLQPLPSWVRTPRRVLRWTLAKFIIYALHAREQQGLAA